MGHLDLNLKENAWYSRKIRKALARRGLRPDMEEEWDIHGPHQNMNYSVLIGDCCDEDGNWYIVAIYPRAVYEIEDKSDWYKAGPANRWYIEA